MPINFTGNPPLGNTVSSGNTTWTWNGTSWISGAALSINADTLDGFDSTAFVLKTDNSAGNVANAAYTRANNSLSANVGGTITGNTTIVGNLFVTNTTTSISNTTGALTVVGGIGATGNIYADNIYDGGVEIIIFANNAFTRANNSLNANTGGTISNTVIISSANAATSITTGALQVSSGGASISGNVHVGQGLFIANTFSSRFFAERANIISSGLAANNTYRLLDGVVHFHTVDSTANSTANLTGFSDIPSGNSVTMAVLVQNGSAPKYITAVQVDGTQTNVTIKWQGGSAPTGAATSNVDVYSFSVIKTAAPSTYTIFASKTQFGP